MATLPLPIPGAEARFVVGWNVRAEARTYLRDKGGRAGRDNPPFPVKPERMGHPGNASGLRPTHRCAMDGAPGLWRSLDERFERLGQAGSLGVLRARKTRSG
jgi:hypothetical protein